MVITTYTKLVAVGIRKKKRSEKISGKLIGRITAEGLCIRSSELVEILAKSVSVKEYGASHYLYQKHNRILQALQYFLFKQKQQN